MRSIPEVWWECYHSVGAVQENASSQRGFNASRGLASAFQLGANGQSEATTIRKQNPHGQQVRPKMANNGRRMTKGPIISRPVSLSIPTVPTPAVFSSGRVSGGNSGPLRRRHLSEVCCTGSWLARTWPLRGVDMWRHLPVMWPRRSRFSGATVGRQRRPALKARNAGGNSQMRKPRRQRH